MRPRRRWFSFVNLSILVVTLLSIVFCKMEIRRMGYLVWKMSREEKLAGDRLRLEMLTYAKLTRPERIEDFATKYFDLKKASSDQLIHMEDVN